jgi:hypothetical protein
MALTGNQTSYVLDKEQYRLGQLLSAPRGGIVTVVLDAETPVGVAVSYTATEAFGDTPVAVRPTTAPEVNEPVRIGFTLLDETAEQNDSGELVYPAGAAVSVLRRGEMVAPLEDAMSKGLRPFIRHAAPPELGGLRSDAAGGNATQATNVQTVTDSQTIDGDILAVISVGG